MMIPQADAAGLFLSVQLPTAVRWCGAVLAAGAFVLLVIARVQLGTSFSVKAQPKGLVTHGLYSRIRHPMFMFVSLTIFGLALALSFPYLLLFLVVFVPLQFYRSRQEDRLLEEKFGQAYLEYKEKTRF